MNVLCLNLNSIPELCLKSSCVLLNVRGLRLALNSNFAHFHARNRCFLPKMWRSIQDGVIIKSGVLQAQIRYFQVSTKTSFVQWSQKGIPFQLVHTRPLDKTHTELNYVDHTHYSAAQLPQNRLASPIDFFQSWNFSSQIQNEQ